MEKTMQQLHSSSNRKPKTLHIPSHGVALVLLLFLPSPVSSCIEEEKTFLLGFLDGLSQASGLSTSWQNDTNCCFWEGITRLLSLNLSGNSFSGGLPPELLQSSIVILDVSFNKLNGEFHELQSTPESAMKVINISSNLFTGYFPSATLGSMKNLAALNMSNNSFTGEIPSTFCVEKPFFVVLDLSYNQFHGRIPMELGNCSYLRVLKAGQNQLIGTLPAELFNVTSLEHLSFPNNHLQGALYAEHVVKLRKLIILDLGGNGLNGIIPNSIGQLKRLEELHLYYNNMSGELPSALSNCSNLKSIVLQGNNFQGELTNVNLSILCNLQFLDFRLNNFSGTVPESLYFCSNLVALRLSFNNLQGQISPRIRNLKSLKFLALSGNNFINITNTLHLLSSSKTLSVLLIGANFLHETMPNYDTFYGFENLRGLAIDNCSLYGSLPNWLSKLKKLEVLLLDYNQLSGSVPAWINTLNFIFYLDISNNNLTGEIPTALTEMPTLKSVNSSDPAALKLPVYVGPLHQYSTSSGFPKTLNLGNNKLTGIVPPEIGQLKGLLSLNLSFNNLYGAIPQSIGNLMNLQVLDLSYNNLSGAIPYALERLHFLAKFNISNNDLEGHIPTGGQFSTFPDSSFAGNPRLCSPALMHHCNLADAAPVSIISTKESIGKVPFALAFCMFFGVGVLYEKMVLSRYIYLD